MLSLLRHPMQQVKMVALPQQLHCPEKQSMHASMEQNVDTQIQIRLGQTKITKKSGAICQKVGLTPFLHRKYNGLKPKIAKYNQRAWTAESLKQALHAEWDSVCTPQMLKKLCGTMHKRMRQCIERSGDLTEY